MRREFLRSGISDVKIKSLLFALVKVNNQEMLRHPLHFINVFFFYKFFFFSADTIGLHRVENPSHSDTAVTLHLYSPPFSECQSFDERTGNAHKVKVTFWSQFGKRTPCVSVLF